MGETDSRLSFASQYSCPTSSDHSKSEVFQPPADLPFLDDLVIDLLEQAGYGGHDRRVNFLEMRGELVEGGAVMDRDAVSTENVKNGPLKDMRKRQHGQAAVASI